MLQGWMGDSEQGAPASVLQPTPSPPPPTMNRSAGESVPFRVTNPWLVISPSVISTLDDSQQKHRCPYRNRVESRDLNEGQQHLASIIKADLCKVLLVLVSRTSSLVAVARAIADEQNYPHQLFNRDIDSCSSLSSLPSRSFRYLQDQYKSEEMNSPTHVEESLTARESSGLRRSSDAHTPSRSFKYLQDQYDKIEAQPAQRSPTTNNRADLTDIYSKREHDGSRLRSR